MIVLQALQLKRTILSIVEKLIIEFSPSPFKPGSCIFPILALALERLEQ